MVLHETLTTSSDTYASYLTIAVCGESTPSTLRIRLTVIITRSGAHIPSDSCIRYIITLCVFDVPINKRPAILELIATIHLEGVGAMQWIAIVPSPCEVRSVTTADGCCSTDTICPLDRSTATTCVE